MSIPFSVKEIAFLPISIVFYSTQEAIPCHYFTPSSFSSFISLQLFLLPLSYVNFLWPLILHRWRWLTGIKTQWNLNRFKLNQNCCQIRISSCKNHSQDWFYQNNVWSNAVRNSMNTICENKDFTTTSCFTSFTLLSCWTYDIAISDSVNILAELNNVILAIFKYQTLGRVGLTSPKENFIPPPFLCSIKWRKFWKQSW